MSISTVRSFRTVALEGWGHQESDLADSAPCLIDVGQSGLELVTFLP